jgi:hypothetical protein
MAAEAIVGRSYLPLSSYSALLGSMDKPCEQEEIRLDEARWEMFDAIGETAPKMPALAAYPPRALGPTALRPSPRHTCRRARALAVVSGPRTSGYHF